MTQKGHNPIRAIFTIQKKDLPFSLSMSFYFFLVITSFWILKPIKKTIFISHYDQSGFDFLGWHMLASQAELMAKILNMVVAFLAVIVFSTLARRFIRQQLTTIFSIFFIICYLLYSQVLHEPTSLTVWSFYLFGDLFNSLMVATFFAFLNDSVSPETAKRAYGLIVFGGVAGGSFGSLFVAARIKAFSYPTWLFICLGLTLIIMTVALIAGRMAPRDELEFSETPEPQKAELGNPAFEGAKLVFRSRYLLSIVGIVGLYEMVSQIMDFQFTETVAHYLNGKEAIGQQYATGYVIGNFLAMFVQLFLTSFVMTRFGVGIALLFLPVAAMTGSAVYLMAPTLWVGTLLFAADNGFSYSINQSAKESLYVPTSKAEKYRAKAFIDMFVQRTAKVMAIGVSLIITAIFTHFNTFRYLSLLSAAILVVWILVARYAGRRFKNLVKSDIKTYSPAVSKV